MSCAKMQIIKRVEGGPDQTVELQVEIYRMSNALKHKNAALTRKDKELANM